MAIDLLLHLLSHFPWSTRGLRERAMALGLDAIDRRILALLAEDGRVTSAASRVSAIINPLALGRTTIRDEVIGTIPGMVHVRTTMVPWKPKEACDWHVPAEIAEEGAAMR
jgi:hypothetical protein